MDHGRGSAAARIGRNDGVANLTPEAGFVTDPPLCLRLAPKLSSVPQSVQQPRVGGGKRVILQLSRDHPFE